MRKIEYTIIEENGRFYAFRLQRIRGQLHELFQRLATRESPPRRTWFGTRLAADHEQAKRDRFRAELAAFRASPNQPFH